MPATVAKAKSFREPHADGERQTRQINIFMVLQVNVVVMNITSVKAGGWSNLWGRGGEEEIGVAMYVHTQVYIYTCIRACAR